MRIIGGELRGQKLVSFHADHIRPTTDRVKETVFNVLMGGFSNARVLDLFSGTGNLSAEAVSRGASYVEAVERHPLSVRIMLENFQKLRLTEKIQVVQRDVFTYLQKYSGPAFDIIMIDPPFSEKLAHSTMAVLAQNSATYHAETRIVVERSKHESLNSEYASLFCFKEKHFGDKTIHFFAPKAEGSFEEESIQQ